MGIAWLIVPTLIYALLTYSVVGTLALAAIAAGLHFAQTRPEAPENIRPFLPLLQSAAVFAFLGGSLIALGAVVALGAIVILKRDALVEAFSPWWRVQQRFPLLLRRVLAFVLSLLIGYSFSQSASGTEWTSTLLSAVVATIVTFLLIFTPPDFLNHDRTELDA